MERNFGRLLCFSMLGHVIILAILIVSIEFHSPNFVFENSKDAKVINAIVLDASKIQKANPTPVIAKSHAVEKTPEPIKPMIPQPAEKKATVVKKVIALPDHKKKFQKDLLSELKEVQKNKKHKTIEKEFEKELKEAANLKKLQAQRAKALEQQLQSEQDRLASSQAEKMSGVVDKYKALILQAIAQHWLVPSGVDRSLSTQILIRVSSGGTVLDVRLVKSSGDVALDRSARTAVFKASPLPVPTAPDEFALFKEFILKVKPENIVNRDNGLE